MSELDKMAEITDESQIIGEFLEWLESQDMVIGILVESKLVPVFEGTEKLLARFFDIDLKKVEQEKRDILRKIQLEEKRRKK